MFYERFVDLCEKNNIKETRLTRELGIGSSAPGRWKKGSVPDTINAKKIADYFGVSVDYLLEDEQAGNTASNISNSAVIQGNSGNNVSATAGGTGAKEQPADESEQEILRIYRSLSVLEKAKFIQMAFEFDKQEK